MIFLLHFFIISDVNHFAIFKFLERNLKESGMWRRGCSLRSGMYMDACQNPPPGLPAWGLSTSWILTSNTPAINFMSPSPVQVGRPAKMAVCPPHIHSSGPKASRHCLPPNANPSAHGPVLSPEPRAQTQGLSSATQSPGRMAMSQVGSSITHHWPGLWRRSV